MRVALMTGRAESRPLRRQNCRDLLFCFELDRKKIQSILIHFEKRTKVTLQGRFSIASFNGKTLYSKKTRQLNSQRQPFSQRRPQQISVKSVEIRTFSSLEFYERRGRFGLVSS